MIDPPTTTSTTPSLPQTSTTSSTTSQNNNNKFFVFLSTRQNNDYGRSTNQENECKDVALPDIIIDANSNYNNNTRNSDSDNNNNKNNSRNNNKGTRNNNKAFIRSKNLVYPQIQQQYIGKFNLSGINYNPAVNPLKISINIKRNVRETNYMNLTTTDKGDADLFLKAAVRNLINARDVRHLQQQSYFSNGSCPFTKDDYCIKSDGVILTKNPGFYISPETVQEDLITIGITDTNNCSKYGNLTVHRVSPCFPMDYLTEHVKAYCPWDRRRFVATNDTKWSTQARFYVNSGITLGQLDIDTRLTSGFEDGSYTLHIKSSAGTIDSVNTITIRFEYYTQLKALDNQASDRAYKARVTGTQFQIPFYKEIYFKDPEKITVIVNKEGGEANRYVTFNSPNALTLLGSARLETCPTGACLDHFTRWRRVYRALVMNGRPDCAMDLRMYYSYLSFCDDDTG